MMEEIIKERRKLRILNMRFRRNFMLRFSILAVSGSILAGLIIYWFTVSSRAINPSVILLPALLLSSVLVIWGVGIATIVLTILISQRIAGPITRIEKDIDRLTQGNFRIRFAIRKNDEFKELCDALNDMAQSLKEKVAEIKQISSDIASTENSQEAKGKAKVLTEILDKFNT
jgi:methyl-accepting chemotaxis protein